MKNNRKILSAILTVTIFCIFIWYITANWNEFSKLELIHPLYLAGASIFVVINLFSTGMIMDLVLQPLGLKLRLAESFGLALLTRLGNQLAGKAGLVFRASYLKKKHSFSYSKFMATLGATHVMMYGTGALMGLVAVLRLNQTQEIPLAFNVVFLTILLGLLVLFLAPVPIKEPRNRFLMKIFSILNNWNDVKANKQTLRMTILWSFIVTLSQAAVIYFSFGVLGIELDYMSSIFFASVTIANTIIGLTPGGLGVNEGLIVLASNTIGIGVSEALAAALVQRALVLATVLVMAPMFTRILFDTSLFQLLKQRSI